MGYYRKEKFENKETNRSRKNFKKASLSCRRSKMQEVLEKAKTCPLSSTDLYQLVKGLPNFVGVFASDELETLRIVRNNLFFIINLDTLEQVGSHWLAVRISRKSVEIFDSLGFSLKLWQTYPKHLLNFLGRYSKSHNFLISPVLQPPNTYTCGLYCIFYIIYRQKISFSNCIRKFSRDILENNCKLYSYLDKVC